MSATSLIGELTRVWRDCEGKGMDPETVGRAAAYTERRIREGVVMSAGEVRCLFAAFADGFQTGRGHCGQSAPAVCLCQRDFPTREKLREHVYQAHRNWPPEQVQAVIAGTVSR